MSLPGSPFMKTLILKHSAISSTTNTRGQDVLSIQGKRSNINHVGGSLNRHLRKHSGHFKRNSLSDKKRRSWASSTGVVGACDNGERNSESSSFGQQLSWRSSCGGMRKGLSCHPRDIYQQSIHPSTTTQVPLYHQQARHPYMLSYSPSTYLEAHADRLPYVDDSTAVSPAISELDNSFPFLPTSTYFNYPNQISQNYCNNHQMYYCNQSNLDHNHYHYYHNGTTSPPPCSSLNQHSSPHSTTHSASKVSQDSSFPNTGKLGYRSLISSPNHSTHHPSIKHFTRNERSELNQREEGTAIPYSSCLTHCVNHSTSLEVNNKHLNYCNNTSALQPMNPKDAAFRTYDLQVGMTKPSDSGGFLMNSVGEVCHACLIEASDKKLFNYHHFNTNNHLHAANINNLMRDPNDYNTMHSGDFRSRHNSYCSHASRWSYSSHIVDPIQNLRSPTPCLIGSPSREIVSSKSHTILPIEMVNGAGHDNMIQNSG